MQIHSYGDADLYLVNPSAYHEAYFRGDHTKKPDGSPRDTKMFFLGAGIADGWATFTANTNRIPAGVRIGCRLTGFNNVPAGWKSVTVRDNEYADFGKDSGNRPKFLAALRDFKLKNPRVTWIDLSFPYAPSDEPSITLNDCKELGGGDEAAGRAKFFADAKWLIGAYVEVFGKAIIGNLISSTWIRDELLPYQQEKGIMGFRHDSWMRFDWRGDGKIEGENRATLYDRAHVRMGGRDSYYRLIVEQTGNGLTVVNGRLVDQGKNKAPCPVWIQMMGPGGEAAYLIVTDWGNMGLQIPHGHAIVNSAQAKEKLDAWYSYILAPPGGDGGDGGDGGTIPPDDMKARVSRLERRQNAADATIQAMQETIEGQREEVVKLESRLRSHSHAPMISGPMWPDGGE
jgi:hypothetical protein